MNESLLKEELVRYEGNKSQVYLDTLGLPTVGIGHMDRNMLVGAVYGPSQIDALYEIDIRNALNVCHQIECFNILDEVRQRVIIQLAFNMGTKLLGFKKAIAALNVGNYTKAADELQDSKWFGQVGRRGQETCFALRTGAYGWRK